MIRLGWVNFMINTYIVFFINICLGTYSFAVSLNKELLLYSSSYLDIDMEGKEF